MSATDAEKALFGSAPAGPDDERSGGQARSRKGSPHSGGRSEEALQRRVWSRPDASLLELVAPPKKRGAHRGERDARTLESSPAAAAVPPAASRSATTSAAARSRNESRWFPVFPRPHRPGPIRHSRHRACAHGSTRRRTFRNVRQTGDHREVLWPSLSERLDRVEKRFETLRGAAARSRNESRWVSSLRAWSTRRKNVSKRGERLKSSGKLDRTHRTVEKTSFSRPTVRVASSEPFS